MSVPLENGVEYNTRGTRHTCGLNTRYLARLCVRLRFRRMKIDSFLPLLIYITPTSVNTFINPFRPMEFINLNPYRFKRSSRVYRSR